MHQEDLRPAVGCGIEDLMGYHSSGWDRRRELSLCDPICLWCEQYTSVLRSVIYPSELLIKGSPSGTNWQSFQIEVAWLPLWQHLSPSCKLQDVAEAKHKVSLISTGHRESLPEC